MVSIIGNAVIDPLWYEDFSLEHRSSNDEWILNISAG